MFTIVKHDDLTIDVNHQSFARTITEAFLVSPKVYCSLHSDLRIRTLRIRDAVDDQSCFSGFLKWVHGYGFSALSADTALMFLRRSKLLGNAGLALVLFLSLLSASGPRALAF
jgi:hypothetical protein